MMDQDRTPQASPDVAHWPMATVRKAKQAIQKLGDHQPHINGTGAALQR
jgi:hypothetical protein